MSKICLNQFVVHEILKMHYGGEAEADKAHVEWEVNGSKSRYVPISLLQKPIGSLYYPRIVTSILARGKNYASGSRKKITSRTGRRCNRLIFHRLQKIKYETPKTD